jgi:hypothetical protein
MRATIYIILSIMFLNQSATFGQTEFFNPNAKNSRLDTTFIFIKWSSANDYYRISNSIGSGMLKKDLPRKEDIILEKIFYITGERDSFLVCANLFGSKEAMILLVNKGKILKIEKMGLIDSLRKEVKCNKIVIRTFHYFSDICGESISENICVVSNLKLSNPLSIKVKETFENEFNSPCRKGKDISQIVKIIESSNKIKVVVQLVSSSKIKSKTYYFNDKTFIFKPSK